MWCLWWKRNWRTWKVPMISYWLLSVAPFLIGLGLEDSPLVILSLCSLAPFFVISIFSFCFLSSFSVLFTSALWFSAWGSIFEYTSLLLIKKKKKTTDYTHTQPNTPIRIMFEDPIYVHDAPSLIHTVMFGPYELVWVNKRKASWRAGRRVNALILRQMANHITINITWLKQNEHVKNISD